MVERIFSDRWEALEAAEREGVLVFVFTGGATLYVQRLSTVVAVWSPPLFLQF
jgi:hypothetical protein